MIFPDAGVFDFLCIFKEENLQFCIYIPLNVWYNNIIELLWSIVATWQGGELMDENSIHVEGPENMPEKKKLTVGTKIIFFFAIPVLSILYSFGVLGVLGLPVMLMAVAMNVLLGLELEKSAPKLILLLLINLIPFAAVYAYSMSVAAAVNSLYILAFSFPIWLTVCMGLGRSVSIVASAVPAALLWILSFALAVISEKGALDITTVTEVLDTVFAPMKEAIAGMTYEENGVEKPIFASSDVSMMMYYIKATIIGSVTATMLMGAYFSTLAVRILASIFGVGWRLPSSVRVTLMGTMTDEGPKISVSQEPVIWRIDIDGVSIAVYIVTYLTAIFGGINGGMFYTVAMNIFIILSPGFIYCALRSIILGIRKKSPDRFRIFPLILAAVILFVNPTFIVFILCAIGISAAIKDNMARREGMKKRKE